MTAPMEPGTTADKKQYPTMEEPVRRAVREAVLTHARLGNPVATWRDGKVVWLQPEEVFILLGEKPPGGTLPPG